MGLDTGSPISNQQTAGNSLVKRDAGDYNNFRKSWRIPSRLVLVMRRSSVQPVAVLVLALHGLIAISGNAGLHAITGCHHDDDAACCSDEHAIAGCSHHCCQHETGQATGSFVRGDSCLTDSHDCPICQWWYSHGQSTVLACEVMCIGTQPLTGVIGDIGVLLPRPDHQEGFPRGPPSVLLLA